MDDQLLPMFLVYLFFPSLPFATVIIYVLAGFCNCGMVGIEKVREKVNPFVLVKYSEFAPITERQEFFFDFLVETTFVSETPCHILFLTWLKCVCCVLLTVRIKP